MPADRGLAAPPRRLKEAEIGPHLLDGFCRTQEVTDCWRWQEGGWVIRPDPFTDDWSREERREIWQELRSICAGGGAVFALFAKGRLIGFGAVEPGLFGRKKEYMNLSHLFVSREERGKGAGSRLFSSCAQWARAQGAKKLYLSSHSAVETQAFYRGLGCTDAKERREDLVRKEPFDCQLEYSLQPGGICPPF